MVMNSAHKEEQYSARSELLSANDDESQYTDTGSVGDSMIWSVHNDLTEGKLATHDAVSSKLPPRKILSQTEEAA